MSRFVKLALLLCLALALSSCGGGALSSQQPPPPPPPPPVSAPAFVYISHTATNTLSGLNVAGGKPANLPSTLPPPGGTSPAGMAATGKWLYIANSGSATVTGFSFDANAGTLLPLPGSPFPAAAGVKRLALCPSNGGATAPRFIYAVASSAVLGYSIASNGQLTRISGSPFTAGTQPSALAVDANCNFVFVANQGSNNISVFSVNPSTGFLTSIAGSPFVAGSAPAALAIGDGFLFAANSGSSNVSVFTINSASGTGGFLTQVPGSPFTTGVAPSALVYFSPTLYVANAGSNDVSAFAVTLQTGRLTPVTGSPFLVRTNPKAMIAFSPPANNVPQQVFLYVANTGSSNLSGFTIGAGGALMPVQGFPFPVPSDPEEMVFACGQCGFP